MTEPTTSEQENAKPILIPAPDCDILQSVGQIAAWRGISVGQARGQIEAGMIPVHKQPGKSTLYAFKSEITENARRMLKKASPPQRRPRGKKPAG